MSLRAADLFLSFDGECDACDGWFFLEKIAAKCAKRPCTWPYESSNTAKMHENYFTIFRKCFFSFHSFSQQLVIFEFWMNSRTNERKNIFLKKKSFFPMFDNLKSIFADSLNPHIDFHIHKHPTLFPVLFSFCSNFFFCPIVWTKVYVQMKCIEVTIQHLYFESWFIYLMYIHLHSHSHSHWNFLFMRTELSSSSIIHFS